ncbi:MAG: cyclopropane-fatty-acyl-phospholipid synthase [Robiginitomaculum sp.]|nr:MAG: cyclopropane-fatty-acyl-phospholipid synthase [Robiginitomaculum sp.]
MSLNIWARAFYKLCDNISVGSLQVTDPYGQTRSFGQGAPSAAIEIHNWAMISAILKRGDIGLGESYTEGLWDSPNIENLILLALKNDTQTHAIERGSLLQRMAFLLKDRVLRRNNRKGSKKNISAHYDVGNDFYALWLDESMTYSSALFTNPAESLEAGQANKYDRLIEKIDNGGDRVLEIGCGWGGFAERAASKGLEVTGITVSDAQRKFASQRLGDKAKINLTDYRDVKGKFDAIVSIEMIEAVGERYWPSYFQTLKSRLGAGGKIALQAIIVEDQYFDRYKGQSDYIRQYTFPGGMLITPGHIESLAKDVGLEAKNMHRFGLDYARTLREWLGRMRANEHKIHALGYDDAFLRSWHFYLQLCAASFTNNVRTNVVQVELRHK